MRWEEVKNERVFTNPQFPAEGFFCTTDTILINQFPFAPDRRHTPGRSSNLLGGSEEKTAKLHSHPRCTIAGGEFYARVGSRKASGTPLSRAHTHRRRCRRGEDKAVEGRWRVCGPQSRRGKPINRSTGGLTHFTRGHREYGAAGAGNARPAPEPTLRVGSVEKRAHIIYCYY